jgi:hypothetical protein
MNKLYQLSDLLSELEDNVGYFIDFISTSGIQAGIIRLHPGENDTQDPHSADEVYYVGKNHAIERGTFIFVHAGTEHKFHGNNQDLVIFYALVR